MSIIILSTLTQEMTHTKMSKVVFGPVGAWSEWWRGEMVKLESTRYFLI